MEDVNNDSASDAVTNHRTSTPLGLYIYQEYGTSKSAQYPHVAAVQNGWHLRCVLSRLHTQGCGLVMSRLDIQGCDEYA